MPHYERVSFACAAFIISWLRIRHWFLSDANVLKCCKSCLLRSRFPTPFASHDQTDPIVLWWQTRSFGPHSHLSYRVLLEIFSGYLMPMTCLSWRLWNESKRAHSVGVNPPRTHVVRECRDYKGVVQPQAQSFRDVAFSYPKRPQSLESYCSKLLSSCHVFDIPQQWAEFACFSGSIERTTHECRYPVHETISENVEFSRLANGNQITRLPCSGRVEIHYVLGTEMRQLYLQFAIAQLMRVSCVTH